MIHPDPLDTITAYCNHCGKVTEQYLDGTCKECLMNGKSKFEEEEKNEKPVRTDRRD